jgi:glycosyltransferase involved in cell wall biosynthesis
MVIPAVAIVMPVKNEAAGLRKAVESVLEQDYPGELEVCLAIAPSNDESLAIAELLASGDQRVRVVENPEGSTPAGLNLAIRATDAPVIVRVDGHAELEDEYIANAVAILEETGAANVGGIQLPRGTTGFERAVGRAMSSRFGAGDARFHYGGPAGPVDTVYLGVFQRESLVDVGLYDESLIRNQDYELNWRLRAAGLMVWFDPRLRVGYRPRGSMGAVARQYFAYGQWKRVVLCKHRRSMKVRHMVPPATVVACVLGLGFSPLAPVTLVLPLGYLAAVLVASAVAGRSAGLRQTALLCAIYPTMHCAWTLGLLRGPARLDRGQND